MISIIHLVGTQGYSVYVAMTMYMLDSSFFFFYDATDFINSQAKIQRYMTYLKVLPQQGGYKEEHFIEAANFQVRRGLTTDCGILQSLGHW